MMSAVAEIEPEVAPAKNPHAVAMAKLSHAPGVRDKPESEPETPKQEPPALESALPDSYTEERLAYVKGEIERLEKIASEAKLSADVDRFSRAMERWIGIYCKLAGIPDPGSYRPAKPRGRQAAERITPE